MGSIRFVGVIAIAAIVAACGDDKGTTPQAANSPAVNPTAPPSASSGNNRAPLISGDPIDAITAGSTFSFQPSARDPDGHPLVFSVANRPLWASFSTSTGRLRGTPGVGDVGTYSNITISVSDGASKVSLTPFSVDVVGTATGSIMVSWAPPSERSDGSALTDLAGYKLYWGTAPGDYPNSFTIRNPGVVSYVIEQLTPGTYYLVATAFDAQGVESSFSNVASKTVSGVSGS